MVPFSRNPFFVGREAELAVIERALESGQVAAITQVLRGLGGIGKTQTAVEYAYRKQGAYSAVLWTRADDENALTTGFVNIAKKWELPGAEAQEAAVAVKATREALGKRSGWLLIVDNADNPEIVVPFLPPNQQGHIVITSRARNFRKLGIATPLEINRLSEAEALSFLAQSTGRDWSDPTETVAAKELIDEIGGLPLALEQAAAYISKNDRTFLTYLHEFRTKREEKRLLDTQPDTGSYRRYDPASDDYKEYLTVWTTWQLNFEAVQERNAKSADLLNISAFLASDAIPMEIVTAVFTDLFDDTVIKEDQETNYTDLLLPLLDFSLITEDRSNHTFSAHKMVQTVVHDRLSDNEHHHYLLLIVNSLAGRLPSTSYSSENWRLWNRLLPHTIALSHTIKLLSLETQESRLILNQTAFCLEERGQYKIALPLYEEGLRISEEIFGHDHPVTAISLNNVANLSRKLGQNDRAFSLHQRAFDIRLSALGSNDYYTLESMNNLATWHIANKNYEEAENLLLSTITLSERHLGAEHSHLAVATGNLGDLYSKTGRQEQALVHKTHALAIFEAASEPDLPKVVESLISLAATHVAMKNYDIALPLIQRSITICESIFDKEQPASLWLRSLHALASIHSDMGNLALALPLFEQVKDISETIYGPGHIDTANSYCELGIHLYSAGNTENAIAILHQAINIFKTAESPDDHKTAISLNTLGTIYRELGDYVSATPLFKEALDIRRRILGAEDGETVSNISTLAWLYRAQSNFTFALPLYQEALEVSRREVGSKHPFTFECIIGLGHVYFALGDFANALLLGLEGLEISIQELGEDHPRTATICNNVAHCYAGMGKYTEAFQYYSRAQKMREAYERQNDTSPNSLEHD